MRMRMAIIIRASFIIHYHLFIIYLVVLLCCYYVTIMMISVMKHAEDDSRVSNPFKLLFFAIAAELF